LGPRRRRWNWTRSGALFLCLLAAAAEEDPGPAVTDAEVDRIVATIRELDAERIGASELDWDWDAIRDVAGITIFAGRAGSTTFDLSPSYVLVETIELGDDPPPPELRIEFKWEAMVAAELDRDPGEIFHRSPDYRNGRIHIFYVDRAAVRQEEREFAEVRDSLVAVEDRLVAAGETVRDGILRRHDLAGLAGVVTVEEGAEVLARFRLVGGDPLAPQDRENEPAEGRDPGRE